MNIIGPSWRTNVSGLAAILASLAHLLDGIINNKPIDWTMTLASLTSGFGLLFARDNKVSSEAAGAVTPKP